jgi:hypothetical protein
MNPTSEWLAFQQLLHTAQQLLAAGSHLEGNYFSLSTYYRLSSSS